MSKGRLLGDRFELEELIGQGAFGEVYRGRDRQIGVTVAVKLLKAGIRANQQLVERFKREGQALRDLNHPNIIKVLDTFSEDDHHYIVMEYVSRGSLADLLKKQPQLPLGYVLEMALDLSDALIRTHRRRIIHRDIKPANVLLANDGTPRLTDFGVAHIGDLSTLTGSDGAPGTIAYMSPETFRREALDARTDIWAFGVMLYETLVGCRPFDEIGAILNSPAPDVRQFRDDLPQRLIDLLDRMMEKDRERRIASVRLISAEIEVIIQELGGGAARASPMGGGSQADTTGEVVLALEHPSRVPVPNKPPVNPTRLLTLSAEARLQEADMPTMPPEETDKHGTDETSTMRQAIDFDLILTSTGTGYTVQVKSPAGELPPQSFQLPFDPETLPQTFSDIAEWIERARNPRLGRQRTQRTYAQARAFGISLFKPIFTDEILASFRAGRKALRNDQYLRVRLSLPDKLVTLPWELLFDEYDDHFVALADKLSLVRYPEIPRPIKPLRVDGPLQVVVILASPVVDYDSLKLDAERQRLEDAFKDARDAGKVALDIIEGPRTLKQLRTRLRRPVHVVHILCHGEMDDDTGERILIFENADRHAERVNADLLRMHFLDQREQLRLVVLNACQGAQPAGDDVFSGVGAALVRAGVPGVIAMQFDISEDVAAKLTEVLYEELMVGEPVDLALTRARQDIATRFRSGLDWAIPVLFLRSDDGVLFTVADEPVKSPPVQPPELVLKPLPEPVVISPPEPVLTAAGLDALWLQAQIAFFTKEWQKAEALLAQIAKFRHDPNVQSRLEEARRQLHLKALYREICALRDADELQAVIGALEELERQEPKYPDPEDIRGWIATRQRRDRLYEEAFAAYDRTDWASAIATLTMLLDKFPDDAGALALINHARNEQQLDLKHRQAEDQRLQEEAARARREQLGVDLIERGAYDRALDRLAESLQQPPLAGVAAQILAELIANPHTSLDQRLRAAQLVVQVGDPRPGVCDLPPRMAPLTGGQFTIGSTHDEVQHAGEAHEREQRDEPNSRNNPRTWSEIEINDKSITLLDFEIACYPVTNAQFELFIEDNGYDSRQPWWNDVGRTWLEEGMVSEPYYWKHRRFGRANANCPVVGVSWYEAHAFCVWLTQQRRYNSAKYRYRLPSEAEWEYAARGAKRRPYPWGTPEPDAERANFNEAHGGPTPVGCFVSGATPTGIFDMVGNIWEWTGSIFRPYPFIFQLAHPSLSSIDLANVSFAVRGGGWRSKPTLLRASHRYHYNPENCYNNLGFRLVRTRL